MALATEGLYFIAFGAFLAGIVRGFTGFGTAMVFMPIAAQFLGPFEALTVMLVKDLVAPLMHVPRALREGQPGDVVRLGIGAVLAVPLGVFLLSLIDPVTFRWGVSLTSFTLLVLLVAGVRYRGVLTKTLIYLAGGFGGLLAGSVGLPGPPVIMLYMASTLPVSAVRANLTLYLILADLILVAVLWVGGFLVFAALALGVLMIAPYLAGNWAGAVLFRPEAEKVYRWVAYLIIAASALSGMPIWD
ncbi:sulfite exporter TauE/SafE family protein [Boseongicola aestuarii]|uniref:Probable membrane transporter protein n=1 Tax=Boseongicola aestuarii TaxID=1470561 RepID=A0A238IVI3_9RHOB|nr:sulfite exporter TauE/SafE family protein [Boseongicola aestuarii]SMX22397.1 Sulfite exporter TauE/SafE [Boseongicola aestuarii]